MQSSDPTTNICGVRRSAGKHAAGGALRGALLWPSRAPFLEPTPSAIPHDFARRATDRAAEHGPHSLSRADRVLLVATFVASAAAVGAVVGVLLLGWPL